MTYTPADLARIALTLVRVCAHGHPTVLYYARQRILRFCDRRMGA